MTAWLIIGGLWFCGGGLVACVLAWMWNDMQPVEEWTPYPTVRVIHRPFDFERDA